MFFINLTFLFLPANIQDCIDQRSLEMIQGILVSQVEDARRKKSSSSKVRRPDSTNLHGQMVV